MPTLKENLVAVENRIQAACERAGRVPADVNLIWVSKNHPQPRLVEARDLGARIFGENRVQEALEKFPLPSNPVDGTLNSFSNASGTPVLHFIGRMQKNKIRKILPLVAAIHSIDSVELLEAVDRIAGEMKLCPDVFLQVNTSRESAKGGFEPEALLPALSALPPMEHVRIVGLMTLGPLENVNGEPAGPEEARRCFRELAAMLNMAQAQATPDGPLKDLAWLSMGMTGDFEAAIEEGSHFVRIGTGLFGSRPV